METSPKWIQPQRQRYLVELFVRDGLKCQQGHINCPIVEHYLHTSYKVSSVARLVEPDDRYIDTRCYNSNGEPLRDKQGNQLYITLYKSIKVVEAKHSLKTLYESESDTVIHNWRLDDKEARQAQWLSEQKAIHALGERQTNHLRGKFSTVSSDIWHSSQPLFYLEAIGIDGLKLKPFAKVKLAGSFTRLYINLDDSLRSISKNRRRKAIRYNKPLPQSINDKVTAKIFESVNHYYNS
jgi:hypothetical protein